MLRLSRNAQLIDVFISEGVRQSVKSNCFQSVIFAKRSKRFFKVRCFDSILPMPGKAGEKPPSIFAQYNDVSPRFKCSSFSLLAHVFS